MLAEFDTLLIRLAETAPRCVPERTQGTHKDSEWATGLHPTPAGFRKITNKFQEALPGVFAKLSKPQGIYCDVRSHNGGTVCASRPA